MRTPFPISRLELTPRSCSRALRVSRHEQIIRLTLFGRTSFSESFVERILTIV